MGNKMRQFGLVIFGAIAGIMLSLNFSAVANKETQEVLHPLPVEELRAFTEVFGRIKSDYVEPVEDKKLITEAINGMLTGLDPHSAYLDADAFKELQIGTQGEFGGLGIEVSMEDGFVKVISPIEDTPAFRAGIKPGDLIIKLDDTAVKGLSLTDAIKRMRGKPNTPITLTIVAKGRNQADGVHAGARRHQDTEREIEDDRAGLCLHTDYSVSGTNRRKPDQGHR